MLGCETGVTGQGVPEVSRDCCALIARSSWLLVSDCLTLKMKAQSYAMSGTSHLNRESRPNRPAASVLYLIPPL